MNKQIFSQFEEKVKEVAVKMGQMTENMEAGITQSRTIL